MKATLNHRQGTRRRVLVRSGILAGISLLLLATSPWPIQAAQAGPVTGDNVAQRVATAKTAEDHEALAAYYRAQAADKAGQVKRHEAMLKSYENVAGTSKEVMRNHCQMLLQSYRRQQEEYEALAQEHERLAKSAEQTHSEHSH